METTLPMHMVRIALNSMILAAVLVVMTFAMRWASASLRYHALLAGFIALLVLPLMTLVVPSWNIALIPISESVETRERHPASVPELSPDAKVRSSITDSSAGFSGSWEKTTGFPPYSEAGELAEETLYRRAVRILWPWGLLIGWALGMVAILVVQLVRWAGAGFVAEMAITVQEERQRFIADGICRNLGIREPVTICRSDMAAVSMAWGLRNPCIILPADSNSWPDEKTTAVLTHELSHVKRKDNIIHLFAVFVTALYWFNPFVWKALRSLHYEREVACDDSVLNSGTSASSYAKHLMEVSMRLSGPKSENVIPAVMAHSSNLKRRLLSVLNPETNRQQMPAQSVVLCTGVVLLLSLPISAIQPMSKISAWSKVTKPEGIGSTPPMPIAQEQRLLQSPEAEPFPVSGMSPSHIESASNGEKRPTEKTYIDERDSEGRSLLHLAACEGRASAVRALLTEGADLAAKTKEGHTALHCAACCGQHEVVGILLAAGADLTVEDRDGDTPLHCAAGNGHSEIVTLLLAAGANVGCRDDLERTPLHQAAANNHPNTVGILVKAGAPLSVQSSDGHTPLHCASNCGNDAVVGHLLEAGADLKATDKQGQTPLHFAVIGGHAKIVRLLLSAEADVSAKDDEGLSPLGHAAIHGREEILALLQEYDRK